MSRPLSEIMASLQALGERSRAQQEHFDEIAALAHDACDQRDAAVAERDRLAVIAQDVIDRADAMVSRCSRECEWFCEDFGKSSILELVEPLREALGIRAVGGEGGVHVL
jgi:hypothetical protein